MQGLGGFTMRPFLQTEKGILILFNFLGTSMQGAVSRHYQPYLYLKSQKKGQQLDQLYIKR